MIGGIDIQLPTRAGDSSLEIAVRAVRQRWPDAVYENAESGVRYDYFWQIPFGMLRELFVYRDSDVADRWNEDGAVPELHNTMIHLIHDEGLITVAADEQTATISELIQAITSGLSDKIHFLPVEAA